MTHTTNLSLPYLLPNQAQKHVTHNEALKMLDVLVQLSVVDNALSAPPQTPSEGDSYTIASSPSGDWETYENQIAIWHDGAWSFYPPNKGWITWVESNNLLQAYNGTDWVDISGVLTANTAPKLGINATADTINRLSVNSAAILFNKEVDDVQVKLNKHASTDNASFLFQTNFSGRAEIGTTGDDDFHFKVSSDGTTWKEGILIDVSSGEVSFPNTTLNISSSADPFDELVARIFNRVSPSQWGFCHTVSEAYADIAKTTKAVAVDDVVAVIADKSPNNVDLVAGGTDAANKIKLRLDPSTVGVDQAHLTTHFLKVTIPAGGFEGTLIMAYRTGIFTDKITAPAGDLDIWSGHGVAIPSGFIGAFAAESLSMADIEAVKQAFYDLGAGSKPLTSIGTTGTDGHWFKETGSVYKRPDFTDFDFSEITNATSIFKESILDEIILPEYCFSQTTNFQGFFQNTVLKFFDATKIDTSSATSFYAWFVNFGLNHNLDLTRLDTSGVTNMRYMLTNASLEGELDISNWDLSSLVLMERFCSGNPNLKTIKFGNIFNNTSCTSYINSFADCALTQETVDALLVAFASTTLNNGTIGLGGGTNAVPSSVGLAAKATLQGRGWTVTTNA